MFDVVVFKLEFCAGTLKIYLYVPLMKEITSVLLHIFHGIFMVQHNKFMI